MGTPLDACVWPGGVGPSGSPNTADKEDEQAEAERAAVDLDSDSYDALRYFAAHDRNRPNLFRGGPDGTLIRNKTATTPDLTMHAALTGGGDITPGKRYSLFILRNDVATLKAQQPGSSPIIMQQ